MARPNTWGFVADGARVVCLRCGHVLRLSSVMAQYDHARHKHGLFPNAQGRWTWPDVPQLFAEDPPAARRPIKGRDA